MSTPTHIDLYDILPDVDIDYNNYFLSEENIKNELLKKGYYPNGNFRTTEGDSFGPLVRTISTQGEDGETYLIFYG